MKNIVSSFILTLILSPSALAEKSANATIEQKNIKLLDTGKGNPTGGGSSVVVVWPTKVKSFEKAEEKSPAKK